MFDVVHSRICTLSELDTREITYLERPFSCGSGPVPQHRRPQATRYLSLLLTTRLLERPLAHSARLLRVRFPARLLMFLLIFGVSGFGCLRFSVCACSCPLFCFISEQLSGCFHRSDKCLCSPGYSFKHSDNHFDKGSRFRGYRNHYFDLQDSLELGSCKTFSQDGQEKAPRPKKMSPSKQVPARILLVLL